MARLEMQATPKPGKRVAGPAAFGYIRCSPGQRFAVSPGGLAVGKFSFSLRRYDTQARVSVYVSLASVASLLAMTVFVFTIDKGFRLIDKSQFVINYGPTRRMLVLGTGACTILLAIIAFGLGLNSAGQRRNDKPTLSWIGFFIGAGVLCLAAILLFLFKTRGEPVVY